MKNSMPEYFPPLSPYPLPLPPSPQARAPRLFHRYPSQPQPLSSRPLHLHLHLHRHPSRRKIRRQANSLIAAQPSGKGRLCCFLLFTQRQRLFSR